MKREVRYKYMPKEKRKETKEKFKNTEYGKSKLGSLRRLTFEGVLCIVVGALFLVYAFGFSKQPYDYAMGGVLLVSGIGFTFGQRIIRYREYDKFIAETAKSKKRK
jgi:hypothetical protein